MGNQSCSEEKKQQKQEKKQKRCKEKEKSDEKQRESMQMKLEKEKAAKAEKEKKKENKELKAKNKKYANDIENDANDMNMINHLNHAIECIEHQIDHFHGKKNDKIKMMKELDKARSKRDELQKKFESDKNKAIKWKNKQNQNRKWEKTTHGKQVRVRNKQKKINDVNMINELNHTIKRIKHEIDDEFLNAAIKYEGKRDGDLQRTEKSKLKNKIKK